mmetsp:Transcript_11711/g.34705  ORF Transcript_11711/g.34705 Transcript_11711/m.34705 type:complete len:216 (+) Transcript_11711:248-895(+)
MGLTRCRWPPAQVAVHCEKASHSSHSQSTGTSPGQAWTLHGAAVFRSPSQSLPPPLACWTTRRDLYICPPPQNFEQSDQCPQEASTQSMVSSPLEHRGVSPLPPSQGCISREAPEQSLPVPLAYTRMFLVRSWCPVHLSEQTLHWLQSPHLQSAESVTQGPSVQFRKASKTPWQGVPPWEASAATFRRRLVMPTPQVTEQPAQGCHMVQVQSRLA